MYCVLQSSVLIKAPQVLARNSCTSTLVTVLLKYMYTFATVCNSCIDLYVRSVGKVIHAICMYTTGSAWIVTSSLSPPLKLYCWFISAEKQRPVLLIRSINLTEMFDTLKSICD